MKNVWIIKGILLGLVFFVCVLLVKPIGVSTQYSVASGIIHKVVDDEIIERKGIVYESSVLYYNEKNGKIAKDIEHPFNYGTLFILGILVGGMVGKTFCATSKKCNIADEECKLENDSISRIKLFIGGFLLLFGSRMAGGCTSGHMMSGIMQLSLSGFVFTVVMFVVAVIIARKVGE